MDRWTGDWRDELKDGGQPQVIDELKDGGQKQEEESSTPGDWWSRTKIPNISHNGILHDDEALGNDIENWATSYQPCAFILNFWSGGGAKK